MSFSDTDTHFSASTGLRSALEKTSRFVKMGAWQMRMQSRYGKVEHLKYKKNRLRLMLGPHGSGAAWLASNLIRVERGMPFFNTPLSRLEPHMIEADGRWNLPFDYMKETFGKHPAEHLFAQLVSLDENDLLRQSSNRLSLRNANLDQILVHEAQGLLMAEALIRTYNCPTLLVVTDPVYAIDKALVDIGPERMANYLQQEFRSVGDPAFLLRFMGSKTRGFRKVYQRIRDMPDGNEAHSYRQILSLAAINRMFTKLAGLYAKVESLTLRDLILTPNKIYQLGLIGAQPVQGVLVPKVDFRPDISSITASMTGRPQRLSPEQTRQAYQFLAEAGLAEQRPMLNIGEQFSQQQEANPRLASKAGVA
ncbi:hypothetical protein D5125_13135 [Magnetovirga frankeli]|uniref:hypothetical protein n=1 Tax=Magnetovirga frankeli TaxID=947516 RepID=UPI001293A1C9|nr:hypothetical protein D5125_13135 [gamma proteobacterium SS-5]